MIAPLIPLVVLVETPPQNDDLSNNTTLECMCVVYVLSVCCELWILCAVLLLCPRVRWAGQEREDKRGEEKVEMMEKTDQKYRK